MGALCSCGFGSVGVLARRVGSGPKPCEEDGRPQGPPPSPVVWVTSMNPPSGADATLAPTTLLHFRALTGRSRRMVSHPDAVPEAGLNLPRRIDDSASTARVARDLLRSRREDVVLVLFMDDRHALSGMPWSPSAGSRLLGSQPARFSLEPRRAGRRAPSSYATAATRLSAPRRPSRHPSGVAAPCGRQGLAVVDHLVVTAAGEHSSDWRGSS